MLALLNLLQSVQRILDLLRLDTAEVIRRGIQLVFIWVFAYAGIRLVRAIARRIELAVVEGDDATHTEAEQRRRTISQLLRSVGRVVIIAVALLLTLNVFIDIGPILAGAGILGLAVSFGAQGLVRDVIAGFFYLVENQFAVGDVIEVAGKSGVVERMTLRVVTLRDSEGTVHVVPNGQITTVSNKTRKWSRAVVDVDVAYETDLDSALAVLHDEARAFAADPEWESRLDGDLEVLGVESMGESGIKLRTLVRTRPGAQWQVGREYRRRLKNRLSAEGIRIPYGPGMLDRRATASGMSRLPGA